MTTSTWARGVPTRVVSAATERGVVRGISHFTTEADIRAEVEKAVGVLVEAQWSSSLYMIPNYFEALAGFSGWDLPCGVYLFLWDPDHTTDWHDPAKRLEAATARLLWRPRGWTKGSRLKRVSDL